MTHKNGIGSCFQVAIGVWPAPWTPHHWRLPSQCAVLMRTPCIHCSSGGGRSGMCERAETKRTAVTAEIRILKTPKGSKGILKERDIRWGSIESFESFTASDNRHIWIYIYIYQHMPMGAKTAPLRKGLRYGTRLISWLLSSHFWLFHLHTSCFPSGAIKAVIVCRSLPSAAWQRLMLMMTSGMMASNTDPPRMSCAAIVMPFEE